MKNEVRWATYTLTHPGPRCLEPRPARGGPPPSRMRKIARSRGLIGSQVHPGPQCPGLHPHPHPHPHPQPHTSRTTMSRPSASECMKGTRERAQLHWNSVLVRRNKRYKYREQVQAHWNPSYAVVSAVLEAPTRPGPRCPGSRPARRAPPPPWPSVTPGPWTDPPACRPVGACACVCACERVCEREEESARMG